MNIYDILSVSCYCKININLWLSCKLLTKYSPLNYINTGKLTKKHPELIFLIPPSDSGYNRTIKKIDLFLVVSHITQEYCLYTPCRLIWLLDTIKNRWGRIFVYPFMGSKMMITEKIIGYNFAIIDNEQYAKTKGYICDPLLLKRHKYTKEDLIQICKVHNIDYENKSEKILIKEIYGLF